MTNILVRPPVCIDLNSTANERPEVTAMLLTGGSAVVTALTGMPTAAACFLLPIGVVLYTIAGGIKATFLTDYVHTVMILIIIFIFVSLCTNEPPAQRKLADPKFRHSQVKDPRSWPLSIIWPWLCDHLLTFA